MSDPITVLMPLALTPEMLRAVREDPTTAPENWEEWHTKLGWLICAWDVLVASRPNYEQEEKK